MTFLAELLLLNSSKAFLRLIMFLLQNLLLTPYWYEARIRVMNYHKELKKTENTLFHAAYREMTSFSKILS